jgi:hypothetical protein
MTFWIGLYPKPFFQILEQPVNQIVQDVRNPRAGGAVNAALEPAAQTEITVTPAAATASATNSLQSTKGNNR